MNTLNSLSTEPGAVQIRAIHTASDATYGSPRIFATLRQDEHPVSRRRVERVMRQAGIRGVIPRRAPPRTTDSNHAFPVAENILDRRFAAERPNERWATDITYVPTREGWLYLAVVLDLFSRRVVGWSMDETMTTDLVLETLDGDRQPAPRSRSAAPLRSGQPVRERAVSASAARSRDGLQHESQG